MGQIYECRVHTNANERPLCVNTSAGRYKYAPIRSTVASDVNGFTNAVVTWMS